MYPYRQVALEFDKKEKKEADRLKKEKLKIPFILEHFNLQYGLTRYDETTGILVTPYRIEIKHSDDGFEDRFFKKYSDIVIAEVLTDEQLVRKRKMQLEIKQQFSLTSKQGLLNVILKNRILFPFYFRRYWMKLTQERYDMKYVLSAPDAVAALNLPTFENFLPTPNLNELTPVLVIEGALFVSIKHFSRDLLRNGFCNIVKDATPASTDQILLQFLYKLPNLFLRFNLGKTQEEMLRFIKEDFLGLERFRHFWHYQVKKLFGVAVVSPIIEWAGEKAIKIIPQKPIKQILTRTNLKKAAITIALVDQLQQYRKLKKVAKKKKKKK